MVELRNISKVYKEKNKIIVNALSNVNIKFNDKGMVFVVGKSGSGKSTLLNIIGGLDYPTTGELLINDQKIDNYNSACLDNYRNTYVGFVFQEFNLINDLSVGENIKLALGLQSEKNNNNIVRNVLENVCLEGYEERKPSTLSGGEKQRVAIARCLVKKPEIILADEPTGSLDSDNAKIVLNSLKEISKDKLVIVISHDKESANEFGDRIIELKDGKISSDISKHDYELIRNPESKPFKKSNLPIGKCLKLGLKNVIHKPIKFVFSSFLTGIALAFFGIATTLLLFDESRCISDAGQKNHLSSDFISKNIINEATIVDFNYLDNEEINSSKTTLYATDKISKGEIENLNTKTKNGLNFAGVYSNGKCSFDVPLNGEFCTPFSDKLYSCSYFTGFSDCGETYLNNNDMLKISGHYPKLSNEIAISKYHADAIQKFYEDNGYQISYEDLIGKTLRINLNNSNYLPDNSEFKITGIYNVQNISTYYLDEFEKRNNLVSNDFFDAYINYMNNSYNCICYVSEDFYDNYSKAFEKETSLLHLNRVGFNGLILSENENIDEVLTEDCTEFLFSRFNNMENFSFYDLNGEKTVFKEPNKDEIYISKKALEKQFLGDLTNNMYSVLSLIEDSYSYNLLPELEIYLSNEMNLYKFSQFKIFLELLYKKDSLNQITPNDQILLNDIVNFAEEFYFTAFKRLYVLKLINDLDDVNRIGGFQRDELDFSSTFVQNYVNPIKSGEFNDQLFDECIYYIKQNQSFNDFATNVLHYSFYSRGSVQEIDSYFEKIDTLIRNGKGDTINFSVWSNFNSLFENMLLEMNPTDFYSGSYTVKNILSICNEPTMPSISTEIVYPSNLFFKNYLNNKGSLKVVGLFEIKNGSSDCFYCYFANEEYVKKIGLAPKEFSYFNDNVSYKSNPDQRYDYLISKFNFSIDEVNEVMKQYDGYQYRFCNKELESMNTIFIILEQFYIITIGGSLIFGIFAAMLLINFITTSISFRKKEIGIIRCLGGRSVDVLKMFLVQSFSTSIASGLVSCLLCVTASEIINKILCNHLTFSILNFGVLNALIVFAVCVLFSLLATIFPIYKISKMSPSSIVRSE